MDTMVQALKRQIFPETDVNVFVVLDGASVPDLVPKLFELQPEHFCLYLGELAPDMAEVAPYLIHLQSDSHFANWLIQEGWGGHWGIFVHSNSDLRALRHHFRIFLTVHDNNGKPLLFRYYDPRVLRVYLPTCNSEELGEVFGPVETYLLEDENPNTLLRYRFVSGALEQQKAQLKLEQTA
jgi:hypothetical protein